MNNKDYITLYSTFGMDVIRVGNHWYRRKQGLITD